MNFCLIYTFPVIFSTKGGNKKTFYPPSLKNYLFQKNLVTTGFFLPSQDQG